MSLLGDWPKLGVTKQKPKTNTQVFVTQSPLEVHHTGADHANTVVCTCNEMAFALRILRLLREDEKIKNRRYRDVSYRVFDRAANKYLSY